MAYLFANQSPRKHMLAFACVSLALLALACEVPALPHLHLGANGHADPRRCRRAANGDLDSNCDKGDRSS